MTIQFLNRFANFNHSDIVDGKLYVDFDDLQINFEVQGDRIIAISGRNAYGFNINDVVAGKEAVILNE